MMRLGHRREVGGWRVFARIGFACAASIVLALVASACGGGSKSGGESSSSSSSSSGLKPAEQQLEKLYKGIGYSEPEPGPKPKSDQNVWIISLAQNIPSSATVAGAAAEAAKALGWKSTIVDGKANVNTILGGMREAIVAKANVIALVFIDCPVVKSGIEEAQRAGIKVVADEAVDCNEAKKGAKPLFDYVTTYYENKSFAEFYEQWGGAQAIWNIVATEGEAKTLELYTSDAYASEPVRRGYQRELKTCGGCEITGVVEFTASEYGPPLQQKVQEGLLRYPQANTISVLGDSVLTTGGAAAIRQSNRLDTMEVMGGEGSPAGLQLIREEAGMDAAVGVPLEWEAYAMMQGANAVVSGQEPDQNSGIGIQVVDREHNLPAQGGFEPPIDFIAAYERMWR